jgi:Carboxypeptidase regulatory-like domain/TonB dependent receptor
VIACITKQKRMGRHLWICQLPLTVAGSHVPSTAGQLSCNAVRFLWLPLALLLLVPAALSQAGRGGISGTVTDRSGAVIQAAQVEAKDIASGAVFRTVTTGAGLYSFVSLPPANYDVTVRCSGFETALHRNVLVTVDQTTIVNVSLPVGAASEMVTVTETTSLLEPTNSTVGQLITAETMDRVPLLTRDEYELVQLSAGVGATNGTPNAADTSGIFNDRPGADVSAYTINGALQGSTYYSVDGSPFQIGENNLGALIPAWQVPLDAIQEFRVETQNVPATYQSGESGVISLVTKAGGNVFHGDAFGYLRPNTLAANDYFVKQDQIMNGQSNTAPGFHRYQEGGSIGGPIRRDKLFFFTDYEATQQGLLQTAYYTVPTMAERTGDFSADLPLGLTIYDPLVADQANGTRQAFPDNKIPMADQNATALAYTAEFPQPNQPEVGEYHLNNYFASGLQPNNAQKFDIRMDFNQSAKQHIFGRFSFDRNKFGNVDLYGASNIYDPNYYQNVTNGRNVLLADDWTFSPKTLLQLRVSYTRHYEDQTGDPRQIGFDMTSLGFPASLAGQQVYKDIPLIDFEDFTTNLGSNWYTTFLFASMVWDTSATLTTTKGRHTLSAGFDFQKQLMNEGQPVAPSGVYEFDNTATSSTTFAGDGSDFASFLLGMGSCPGCEYDNFTKDIFGAQADPYYAAFLQDDYRIVHNLTLNLGLRWDIFGGRTERYNRQEYWDPSISYTLDGLPFTGGEQFPGVDGHPRSPFATNMTDFAPRLGFAWQPVTPLVVRGGFGMAYGPSTQMVGNNALNTDGFYAATAWNATTYNADGNTVMLNSLSNPFPNGVVQATGSSLGPATNIGVGLDTELHTQPTPVTYNYNFEIEYQLPAAYIASAAYVGSHGLYLPLAFGADQDQLPLSTIAEYQSALMDTMVPDQWEAIWPATSQFYGAATVPMYLSVEPYPQFSCGINCGVGQYAYPAGHSNYNSLQVKLQKRLTHHFETLAEYTWSKLLTNDFAPPLGFIGFHGGEAPQDWKNLNLDYSISPQDLSYTFSWEASWDLPVGEDRALKLSGWPNQILGGWTFNSILYLNSGVPLNSPTGTGDVYFNQRVDLACNPAKGAPHTVAEWLTYTCFSQPPSYFVPGTAPAFLSSVRTEGGRDLDVSLFKNFRFGENKKLQLQVSSYNVANYVQLGAPNIFWNPSPTPANMAGFGQITSDLNTPRQFQFAARFTF